MRACSVRRGVASGFTLVELMIVVVIIAIIVAFGYPAYRNYIVQARRVDGQALLSEMAARQENFRADNRVYAAKASDLGYSGDSVDSPEGFWSASVKNVPTSGQTFEIHAVPKGTHKDDQCSQLTFNDRGQKGYKPAGKALRWDGQDCWK